MAPKGARAGKATIRQNHKRIEVSCSECGRTLLTYAKSAYKRSQREGFVECVPCCLWSAFPQPGFADVPELARTVSADRAFASSKPKRD